MFGFLKNQSNVFNALTCVSFLKGQKKVQLVGRAVKWASLKMSHPVFPRSPRPHVSLLEVHSHSSLSLSLSLLGFPSRPCDLLDYEGLVLRDRNFQIERTKKDKNEEKTGNESIMDLYKG